MSVVLVCIVLWFPATTAAATRYDPHLRFRSMRTTHFTVLFHQGEEVMAARLARMAEAVHAKLSRELQVDARRHTYVILVDQHDRANGWATPLPFNTIEISAAAPAPSDEIGNTDDWLRLVFTHEYTHILHLDRSRGLFGGLRYVFGRAPLLFPNMFLAGWETEGLATFYETKETGLGRLASGEFRLIVDAAARAGRFDPIDRATGALVDWPGGNSAYAYGSRFHEYLARRFGVDAFGRLAAATSGRVPYFPGGAYKHVFGASAKDLWKEFADRLRPADSGGVAASSTAADAVRLTHRGFLATGPRWLPDGSLVYTSRTPHGFPSIEVVASNGRTSALAERYLGEKLAVSKGRVYFDQQELVRNVGLQSDLYVVRISDRHVQRLTRQARASDPDISPDGRWLVYVVQQAGRASMVVRQLEIVDDEVRLGEPRVLRDDQAVQYAAPRWSPDGRLVAAERRGLGERPDVIVVDAERGSLRSRVWALDGRVGEPDWVSSRLVVSWERPEAPFNLYEVDLADPAATRTLVELPTGARSAAISPAGDRVAFVGYDPDGYDIFSIPISARSRDEKPGLLKIESGAPERDVSSAGNTEPAPPGTRVGSYSPAGTLLPRFWMPEVQTDEDRIEAGAGTAGIDALGRHAYASTVRWSDRARPDWDVSYAYDRWRPTLFVSASDDLTVWRGDDYRETSVETGMLLPFTTVRRRQSLYAALNATREEDPSGTFARRALRFGYQFSTTRRYGYSISPQDGLLAGVTTETTRKALGSDADATTLSADLRAYPRVGGPHRVLALRAAFAGSFGDREGRRVFGAGGTAAPSSTITFGHDVIGLARGFATDDIVGDRAAVVNVDYRVPLWNVERGIGMLPVFVRQLHVAAFADGAHAWTRSFRMADARASAGFELSSDLVLGHYLPLTIAGGVAFRHDPAGLEDGPAAFWRIGYAF